MTLPTIAVTGATGNIGGIVAKRLAQRGIEQRLLARSPENAPSLPRAVTLRCKYEDSGDSRAALDGVDVLFMVSGAENLNRLRDHLAFIDAAAACGVRHVVYLSFFEAAPDATFTLARDHWVTEQHIIDSGMAFTFLRNNFYTELFVSIADENGVIRGPAEEGLVAPITRADVAAVAFAVLQNPDEHVGKTYDLTGPEELSLKEIAATIAEATGKSITFHNETVSEAYDSRRTWDVPQWQYDAWVSTYTAIAAGELVPASDSVEQLTGTRPQSLLDFLASES